MKVKLMAMARGELDLDADSVLCNDITMPTSYNPHGVRLWIIGHEYGAVAAAWGDCMQDALDEAFDNGLLDCFKVPDGDYEAMPESVRECLAYLGNACEPCDLERAWIDKVDLNACPEATLYLLYRAAYHGWDNLGQHGDFKKIENTKEDSSNE